jgi:hypothetical protein
MPQWPHDDTAALSDFYGPPGQPPLVQVVPPWQMTYEGQPIDHVEVHTKCASALQAAFTDIWAGCHQSQAEADAAGVSRYSGIFNPRRIRGSNRWSTHAWACAIDLDASNNPLWQAAGRFPEFVINAFKKQGAFWGGEFIHRPDPMHFQFANEDPIRVAALGGFLDFYDYFSNEDCPECAPGAPPMPAAVYTPPGPTAPATYYPPGPMFVPPTPSQAYFPPARPPSMPPYYPPQRGEPGFMDGPRPQPYMQPMSTYGPQQAGMVGGQDFKSVFKSKISWLATALGLGGSTAVVGSDQQTLNLFWRLVENPRVWILLAIATIVGSIFYCYWRDHGKGQLR